MVLVHQIHFLTYFFKVGEELDKQDDEENNEEYNQEEDNEEEGNEEYNEEKDNEEETVIEDVVNDNVESERKFQPIDLRKVSSGNWVIARYEGE